MTSIAPTIGARQCLRLRPRRSVALDAASTSAPTRGSFVAAASTSPSLAHQPDTRSDVKALHTTAARAQAAEVCNRTCNHTFSATPKTDSLSDVARRAQVIIDPAFQALTQPWIERIERLAHKAQNFEIAGDVDRVPGRIVLVGSSLSQTQQLLSAMIDEPLRDSGATRTNESDAILDALTRLPPSTPFTITYAPGPLQLQNANAVALDRHWLQQANLEITVIIDPSANEATYDLIYDSEAVLFVTDDYELRRSAHRSRSVGARGDVMNQLLSRFAAKPNVHLVVNSILGSDHTQILDGLESATGASVSDLVAPRLISVRVSDALAAHSALRLALDRSEQPTHSHDSASRSSNAYWDDFSSHYQRSNVGSLIQLIQTLESRHGSTALVAQSSAFLLQHCLDEALATAKRNLTCLHQLRSLASEAKQREQVTLKQSLERIWPPATAYTGQLSNDDIKVWRPASPGSSSAVDESMNETDALIESTFDTKLQWWKLIWKVDDIRKELESACAGFAASIESDLAYESGRLATMQVEQVRAADRLLLRFRQLAQELGPSLASASRDVVLLTNEAEAMRSSKLRTIEPSTLMEPIHRRRVQLLQSGGPIDVLASKSRKLAVTSSAAVAVTAAGVGSASILGASLVGLDASSAALALDPSTGVGLGLLTLTLVGWRMQGQYNKYRRRFREDWQRFSEGLDQDLKTNFEKTLKDQITGPSDLVSSRILALTRKWGAKVQQQENHVRTVLASTMTQSGTESAVNVSNARTTKVEASPHKTLQ